jgi:subtilisin family serine protease
VLGLSPVADAKPVAAADLIPTSAAAPGRYIVSLAAAPIASYGGGVSGLPATRPTEGRRVSVTSTSAKRYREHLSEEQTRVAARVGVRPAKRYSVTLNGFAATMTPQQARTLQRSPGVVSVTKDVIRRTTDDKVSTDFLRLSGRNGVWAGLGGTARAGRGVVVGVIDSGIWPESRSFAGPALGTAKPTSADPHRPYRSGSTIVVQKSDGTTFTGRCEQGEQFTTSTCNTKLVGARYFGKEWLAANPDTDDRDFISPRDGNGHGSHTASTAAGNSGVAASVAGRSFGNISGVAPAAKVAVYKALWASPAGGSGTTSDIIDAIDAAVTDGVDVINYSVGTSPESPAADPVALAFLSAASAGIFVATSAGNRGPGASTLDNTSPWVTTVAASTIQPYEGTVVLGNGRTYAGSSTTVATTVGRAPLVLAANVKTAAATAAAAANCAAGTLDPAKAAGDIVVCDRGGGIDRVAKSAEVKRAGGVAMVLVNLTDLSTDPDFHTVPTVHLNPPGSLAVRAYAATTGATATLVPGNTTGNASPYPQIAGFSSRGPSLASRGDLLKPDLAAPGVGILAAVAPPSNSGRDFDFYSGTSMATPHVAGLAALHFGAGVHPRWSPMRIKSALMTTATDTKTETGTANRDPFSQGAGQVRPNRMFNPGLVYNSSDRAWLAYLEGVGVNTRTGVAAVDPSDLNTPSIAVGSLLSSQTVTRTVTAVKPGIYRATASVAGVNVRVTPSILTFGAAGQSKKFTVRLTKGSAPFGKAATGFLTWTGAGTRVRSPIAVTPRVLDAPERVSGTGASGRVSYRVTPGVSGPFPIRGYGLAAGTAQGSSLAPSTSEQFESTVPTGAKVAQFTVRSPNDAADLDLQVYRLTDAGPELVGSSGTGSVNETVVLTRPAAGRYVGLVAGFANAPGTTTTPFTYRSSVVAATGGVGGFTVTPRNPTAAIQRRITVTASWSGVNAGTPYVGYVEYRDGSGTVVTVN